MSPPKNACYGRKTRGLPEKNHTFFRKFSRLRGFFFCNPLPASKKRRLEPIKKSYLKTYGSLHLLKEAHVERNAGKMVQNPAKCDYSYFMHHQRLTTDVSWKVFRFFGFMTSLRHER
jgi:hypothetical protein